MTEYFKAIFKGFLLATYICAACPVMANSDAVRFSENVNLSLRRTVDLLLRANGDSLSQIPPVKQVDANTFSVQMEHMFDYDKLPETLQRSFDSYHIDRPYSVAVLNC